MSNEPDQTPAAHVLWAACGPELTAGGMALLTGATSALPDSGIASLQILAARQTCAFSGCAADRTARRLPSAVR